MICKQLSRENAFIVIIVHLSCIQVLNLHIRNFSLILLKIQLDQP